MGTMLAFIAWIALLALVVWLAGELIHFIRQRVRAWVSERASGSRMTDRSDPAHILIGAVMALAVAVLAMTFVVYPPSRPCPPGSIERLLTNCEGRP